MYCCCILDTLVTLTIQCIKLMVPHSLPLTHPEFSVSLVRMKSLNLCLEVQFESNRFEPPKCLLQVQIAHPLVHVLLDPSCHVEALQYIDDVIHTPSLCAQSFGHLINHHAAWCLQERHLHWEVFQEPERIEALFSVHLIKWCFSRFFLQNMLGIYYNKKLNHSQNAL